MVGLHTLGIRLRQTVCDCWIQERQSVDTVLNELQQANFNLKFSPFPNPKTTPDNAHKTWLHRLFA